MAASITLAGEDLIAQKQAAQEVLTVARFVLANVPGLDHNAAVDRAAGMPPAGQIVHVAEVTRSGYVNPRQVVYSMMVGSNVGDWDFNWIGLETEEDVLLAVAYVPTQQKRKNIPPLQIGNNITRNFLVEFNGAQELTGLTVDASTWQHDFTVRLLGIDARERMSNRDTFGRACFLADSLQMEKMFGAYQLKAGIAYVEGIRVELVEPVGVQLPALPAKAWLDVALERQASDVVASWQVVFGADLVDTTDANGVAHYRVPLADIPDTSTITDLRTVEPIGGALVQHFAARNGDYANLRARATTKEDVGLGNLPNAKSDDPTTDSSEILATTKALQASKKAVEDPLVGQVATFAMSAAPSGWLKANGAAVSRITYAALFASIGTLYGTGNGSTTFNLPDLRGQFPRYWDDGRGIDTGRALGSDQDGAIQSHGHTGSTGANGGHTHTGSTSTDGAHSHDVPVHSGIWPSDGPTPWGSSAEPNTSKASGTSGSHGHILNINPVPDHTHPVTINATGGAETRPRNTALLACIKY
ncbi:phage tail protein [Pseudomonas sp. A-1]|uniref:phage tail-collar fiber domain-containing protein n=1 Tax=Pseudomonas sp. A-1 TaxID=1821274 RepID=UPI0010A62444|nr:phage tail protein [Pseudomonas sp. A-1]THG81515.1 phage tail protein [Pseudomonas sp. A-1]